MKSLIKSKEFFKYLSYDNAPHWVNVFIHIGFGAAILTALAILVMNLFII